MVYYATNYTCNTTKGWWVLLDANSLLNAKREATRLFKGLDGCVKLVETGIETNTDQLVDMPYHIKQLTPNSYWDKVTI